MQKRNSQTIEEYINGDITTNELIKRKGYPGYTVNRILTPSQREEYEEKRRQYIAKIRDYMITEANYFHIAKDVHTNFPKYGFSGKGTFDLSRNKGELPTPKETSALILEHLKDKSEEEIKSRGFANKAAFEKHYKARVEDVGEIQEDETSQNELIPYSKTRKLFEQEDLSTAEIYDEFVKRYKKRGYKEEPLSLMNVSRYRTGVLNRGVNRLDINVLRLIFAEVFADCYDVLVENKTRPNVKQNNAVFNRLMKLGRTLRQVNVVMPQLKKLKELADLDDDFETYKDTILNYNANNLLEVLALYFEIVEI